MLVCIDFDGVIADSLSQQLDVVVAAQAHVAAGRIPTVEDFRRCENLNYQGFGELIGIPPDVMPRWQVEIQRLLIAVPEAPFFPNLSEILRSISKDAKLAIITSNIASVVQSAFHNNQLEQPAVYDLFRSLNKAEKIIDAARELNEPLSSTLMVGDTRSDIRHGREAGVRTVAVTWGYHSRDFLALESPDFFADSPDSLLEVIRSLRNQQT